MQPLRHPSKVCSQWPTREDMAWLFCSSITSGQALCDHAVQQQYKTGCLRQPIALPGILLNGCDSQRIDCRQNTLTRKLQENIAVARRRAMLCGPD
jgi:hypothetical protein